MEQKSLITVVKKWWLVLVGAALVGALLARLIGGLIEPTYESTVRLLTGPTNADAAALEAAGGLARSYAELATSQPQLQAVATGLGLELTPDELVDTVKATSNDVTRIVAITARRPTAEGARDFVDRLADRMVALSRETRVENETLAAEILRSDAFEGITGTTLTRIREAIGTVLAERSPGLLTVVDPPRAAAAPTSPRMPLLILLGAIAGVAIATVVILWRERSAATLDSSRDLAETVPAPMLGIVQGDLVRTSLITRRRSSVEATASMRRLADEVDYIARDGSVKTLAVLGSDHGGPAGSVAANLAVALSGGGFRVVVLDADPDGADATRLLSQANGRGGLDDRDGTPRPPVGGVALGPDLHLIPAEETSEVHRRLDPDRIRQVLAELGAEADMILIATPPLTDSSDALIWSEQADGVILCAEQGITSARDLLASENRLRQAGIAVVGTVFCTRRSIPGLAPFTAFRRGGSDTRSDQSPAPDGGQRPGEPADDPAPPPPPPAKPRASSAKAGSRPARRGGQGGRR